MTRKKSNVKALALAVTCAILAGGYSGLNPVYAAADTLYKDGTNVTTSNTPSGSSGSNEAIEQLTVGSVTIGGTGGDAGQIIAKNIVGITNVGDTTPSAISINGATFANGGAITANGLTADSVNIGGLTISSVASGSTTSANNYIAGIKDSSGAVTAIGISGTKFESNGAITASSLKLENSIGNVADYVEKNRSDIATNKAAIADNATYIAKKANQTDLNTANGKITALEEKTAKFNDDGTTLTGMDEVSAATLKVDGREITGEKVDGYDAAVEKTANITRNTDGSTTVDGVKFKAGAVSGVSGINDDILQFTQNGTENIVQINSDLRLNDNTGGKAAILSVEGLAALNSMVYDATGKINNDAAGKPIIQAGNGSVVGGVKLDNKNIANVDSITVNEGKENQVKITSEGIVVGLTSAAINGDGFYAGGHNYNDAKAALDGKDGKIKGAGGKFGVDDQGNVTTTGDIKGKDITASGNLTVDGDVEVKKDLKVTGNITGADITASGALKGKTLGIGTNGTEFTVDADGAVKAAGGKVEIDKTGKATFGDTANNRTTIAGKLATFGENTSTDYTTINGGKIDTYDLTVRNDMTVKNFKADNITSTNRITVGAAANEVYLDANGTLSLGVDANQKLGKTQLANINDTIKTGKVIDANSATIGGVEIIGGNVTTATGTIQGNTISDGAGAKLNGGKITANEGKIGNVEITTAGAVSGVTSLTVNGEIKANVFKVDDDNYLNNSGITAKGGNIGAAVVDATTLTVGGTKLDKVEGITTNKLAIGGMTLTGTSLDTGTANFQVNGVTFNQGEVAAKADKGFVAGTSSFKQGSLIVDAKNKLEVTSGLTTEKATVNGTLDVSGKATFGTAGSQTAIDGNTITTDTLKANKLILGASGTTTVEVDKDGSLKAANGKFEVDKDGALKAANGAFNVDKDGKTTFTKDANNLSSINGGNIWAKATDIADNTSSELTHDYKGLHIKGNKSGQKSAFDFDTSTGIGTFTGQDNSTTKINGSAIRSEKSDGTAGKLDGENLTLYKDANNQTTMSAGKVTFKSANAGKYGGTETTIDGGVITTDTLNVQRINLGKEMVNGDGTTTTVSNLSIDEYGNIKAAGGNFTVAGINQTNPGALHNEVGGKTFLDTTETGASMKFDNTAATDGVKSEVSVEANKATVAAGDKASFVANTDNGGTATITGGTQTVTTTGDGTVFKNSAHNTPFGGGSETKTTINGNEITTGKITTDQLVIKGNGSGAAAGAGSGSIALGGNGSITSNIKDAVTGKEATFKTDETGTFTEAKDSAGNKTTNTVNAQGNTNEVTDGTNTSTATQTATAIGGVITNGTVKLAEAELNKDGFTVKQKDKTDVKIADGDVTVTNNRNTTDPQYANQTVHLSDLGSLNNLEGELTARDEYQNNKTAVGGINAEAAIRREEVARLDNRIDDVNNRVDKVGAMAAAIASLKSIGYDPQAPSEFSIGLGQYKGETGVAMGFFHYPNKNFMINVSLSTAGGETMGGIGATWRFGHKSPQKLLDEQREAQARKELAAAEKYQAAAKLAKEAQERAEYAAKLARQAQVSADNAKAAADATQAKHFQ